MLWYPETNAIHKEALDALDAVAKHLKTLRSQVAGISKHPEVVKAEAKKLMDAYLVRSRVKSVAASHLISSAS